MSKRYSGLLAAILSLGVAAGSTSAGGEPDARTRVTIRGTGNNVSIERIEAAQPQGSAAEPAIPRGPLADAVRMKRAGREDWELISYLRTHSEGLPSIIDAREIKQLRDAGAGKSVILYLESASAVEIGPTAERRQSSDVGARSIPDAGIGPPLDSLGSTLFYGRRSQSPHLWIRRPGPAPRAIFVTPRPLRRDQLR